MIKLPTGAFMVQREIPESKSLIIGVEEKQLNRGTIVFTSEELNQYQLCPVVFRESFSEPIKVGELDLLYFRDFNSSIYYVTTNKKE